MTGDVHGAFDELMSASKAAKVCDRSGEWIAKNVILLQTGNLIHKGPNSVAVARTFIHWQQTATEFNSDVIVLRGNHEDVQIRFSHHEWSHNCKDLMTNAEYQFGEDDDKRNRETVF